MSAVPVPLFTDNIPQELRALDQWVCWRYVTRDGKRTKLPISAKTGAPASSNDPTTWSTFGEATIALEWSHHDGVGFVFTASDPYFMIDLDDARDIDTNQPWAEDIVSRFPIYWEVSASGAGLKGIGRGKLPERGNRKGKIELYDTRRFTTITGQSLDGDEIGEDCTEELARFHREIFEPVIRVGTPVHENPATPPLTDDEVLERALNAKNGDKLRALLSGDTLGYDSQSEAEMAAVGILKFWTQDPEQIERILRLSSLQREKWDNNKTYLDRTITNALQQPSEHYEPPNNVIDFRKHLGGGGGGNGNTGEGDTPGDDRPAYGFRLSDLGNGQRLAHRIRSKAMYCHPAKRWYVYDGKRWNSDDMGWLLEAAKQSVLTMYDAMSALPDKERTELLKHALKSESERALKAAIGLATSEPGIPVLPDVFDRDPMQLNIENGTLDLTTGDLLPHQPDDLISKMAPVQFDPDAACPRWIAFLEEIFEGDADRIRYMQKALGYTLTGKTTERAVFFLWGVGKNGKSTLLTVMSILLGDYAQKTPTETIMAKRNDGGIPNDIAALKGARLVTASETEENRRLNVAKVKDMSGNEELTARFLHGEFFKFRPQFKLWLSTNHKPVIPGNDRAMFDRCKLVPFTYRVPDDKIDKELEAKLLAEAPGILNWLIEGCLAWQQEGLQPPKIVQDATDQYRQEMDQLGAFIADRCIVGPDYRAATGDLYAAFKAWCEVNGERAGTSTWFGRQLTEREFDKVLDGPKRVRTWIGIGLLDNNNRDERVQPAQSANSGVFSKSSSHEGENTGKPAQESKTRSPAQAGFDGIPTNPVPDEEGWL